MNTPIETAADFHPRTITRPERVLLQYYIVTSALTIVLFPFVFLPQYVKYRTLRYRFDDEGISMAWGLLWRKEINLTYRRIQDIHLTRNLIERWMGLSTVSVQTASGSSGAEMSIVGITRSGELRDWLYTKMRGARGLETPAPAPAEHQESPPHSPDDEALVLLREIRDELRQLAQDQGAAQ